MLIDQLSKSLVKSQDKEDVLTRIELESRIELILMRVKKIGYLDVDNFIELTLAGVPFIKYLKKYKNISSDQAKELIKFESVTYDDLIRVLQFGIENLE